jgi:hypothetical protein
MVTLPPKVPEIAPASAEVGGGRVSVEITKEPVELTKDAGTKDAGTTKGNPQLSKKYAPELLCYSCWQVGVGWVSWGGSLGGISLYLYTYPASSCSSGAFYMYIPNNLSLLPPNSLPYSSSPSPSSSPSSEK